MNQIKSVELHSLSYHRQDAIALHTGLDFGLDWRPGGPCPLNTQKTQVSHQAVFIQVTERWHLNSLLPAVKTSCWKQLSCHPKQKYFRGGTSLPQNFGLDSSTLLIEKRVKVKIGLSHSKRLYYRYKEYFCSLSWRKSLEDTSLFHNRSTFFQKPWKVHRIAHPS